MALVSKRTSSRLEYIEQINCRCVDDVQYLIDQATDWKLGVGDYCVPGAGWIPAPGERKMNMSDYEIMLENMLNYEETLSEINAEIYENDCIYADFEEF